MPKIEHSDISCELGRKIETPEIENLDYFQNLGIINKNTLILKTKFKESPETEIYLPVHFNPYGNFTTKLKIGKHTLKVIVFTEDYKLTAKHWSELDYGWPI